LCVNEFIEESNSKSLCCSESSSIDIFSHNLYFFLVLGKGDVELVVLEGNSSHLLNLSFFIFVLDEVEGEDKKISNLQEFFGTTSTLD
jgi:hypothetical protein